MITTVDPGNFIYFFIDAKLIVLPGNFQGRFLIESTTISQIVEQFVGYPLLYVVQ